jgi:hypothetical protein
MAYKMKGFSGFKSPAKVSDSDVRDAVSKVNEAQMAFKEPGWAKLAGTIHSAVKGPLGEMMKKKGKGKGKGTKDNGGVELGPGDVGSVQKTAGSKLLPDDYFEEGSGGFGSTSKIPFTEGKG